VKPIKCPNCGAHIAPYAKGTVYYDPIEKRFCSQRCLDELLEEKKLARIQAQKAQKKYREQKELGKWFIQS
jgi:hypothetical protein